MTQKQLARLSLLFIFRQALLVVLSFFADKVLPYKPSFSLFDLTLMPSGLPRFIYSFANFDGVHYVTIAREGYTRVAGIQAFFPLFPRIIMGFFSDYLGLKLEVISIGLILANLFFLGFLIVCFKLIQERYTAKLAWISIIALLVFPTSFFFGTLYTESLFMLLVVATFYCSHHKKWLFAGLLAMLASATRVVGIFLVPALLLELYQDKQEWSVKHLSFVLLGTLGLLAYMLYLQIAFGDALLFAHVQSLFGAGRSTHLVLYPQVAWRSLKILLTNAINLKYTAYAQEFVAGTVGLLAIFFSRTSVRASWTLFALLCFFFPPLTGTFSSMSRYILVCFPIFILWAKLYEKYPRLGVLSFLISFLLLCFNTVLFIQGYWVA